jgi:hypothetical protein
MTDRRACQQHPTQTPSTAPAVGPVDLRLAPAALVRRFPTLVVVDVDARGVQLLGVRRGQRLIGELATLIGLYHGAGGAVRLFAGAARPDGALLAQMGLSPDAACLRWHRADGGLATEALMSLPSPPSGVALAGLYLYHCVARVASDLWAAGFDTATVPRACAEVPGMPAPLQAVLRAWPRTITVTHGVQAFRRSGD